jgi:hypothetical protein
LISPLGGAAQSWPDSATSADAAAQIEDPFAPVERQQPGKIDRCGATARMKLIDRLEVIRRKVLDVLSGRRERGEDHGAQIGGAKVGAAVMSADRFGVSHLRLSLPKARSPSCGRPNIAQGAIRR